MDIVIIGSGNVAAVLGRKFKMAGHNIVQVYSRNGSAASRLAYEWDTESTNYKSLIKDNADVYIIAVTDEAISEVVKDLSLPGKIVAHTAASASMDALKGVTEHYGVFYPLQSLRIEMTNLPDIPLFFEGNTDIAKRKLAELANSISPGLSAPAKEEDRLKLHVAAVFASNFTNHMYALAEWYCRKEGLDFKQLMPLINETATRLSEISPSWAQTGPAIRHDKETIEKHLSLLSNYPALKSVYVLLTESIQGFDKS